MASYMNLVSRLNARNEHLSSESISSSASSAVASISTEDSLYLENISVLYGSLQALVECRLVYTNPVIHQYGARLMSLLSYETALRVGKVLAQLLKVFTAVTTSHHKIVNSLLSQSSITNIQVKTKQLQECSDLCKGIYKQLLTESKAILPLIQTLHEDMSTYNRDRATSHPTDSDVKALNDYVLRLSGILNDLHNHWDQIMLLSTFTS